MNWTPAQVNALAPDAASLKAGTALATVAKWPLLGQDTQALWGECKGSGATPYRTQIELATPAFKCSCPSRKFPCKHGLGLLLLFAQQPDALATAAPPPWVSEWLNQRSQRQEKKAQQADAPPKAPDPAQRAKTEARRHSRAEAGLAELETWLEDLLRRGLASAQSEGYRFYDAQAARLVDAQLPGLARRVRALAGTTAGSDAQLAQLGQLYLVLSGYRHQADLPPELRAEVLNQLGWTTPQADVLQAPGIVDRWHVSGLSHGQEAQLRTQRAWLWGESSGQSALILEFAVGNAGFPRLWQPGQVYAGELVFYPGTGQRRALLQAGAVMHQSSAAPPNALPDLSALQAVQSAQRSANPWAETGGAWLQAARPRWHQAQLWIEDARGQSLPVQPSFEPVWAWLALNGPDFCPVFVEWDAGGLYPLTLWNRHGLHSFARQQLNG